MKLEDVTKYSKTFLTNIFLFSDVAILTFTSPGCRTETTLSPAELVDAIRAGIGYNVL